MEYFSGHQMSSNVPITTFPQTPFPLKIQWSLVPIGTPTPYNQNNTNNKKYWDTDNVQKNNNNKKQYIQTAKRCTAHGKGEILKEVLRV